MDADRKEDVGAPMGERGHPARYNLGAIRDLMQTAFTDKELRRFCQDRAAFRPALDLVGSGAGLSEILDVLLDYCQRRDLFPALLSQVAQANPRAYQAHQDRLYEPDLLPDEARALWPQDEPPARDMAGSKFIFQGGTFQAGRDITFAGSQQQTIVVAPAAPVADLARWRADMEAAIAVRSDLDAGARADLREQVVRIEQEATRGAAADEERLARLLAVLEVLDPALYRQALATGPGAWLERPGRLPQG